MFDFFLATNKLFRCPLRENQFKKRKDEDDFSHSADFALIDQKDPRLDPVQNYVEFLDLVTQSTNTERNYKVSGVFHLDETCIDEVNPFAKIGERYRALIDITGGKKISICNALLPENLMR